MRGASTPAPLGPPFTSPSVAGIISALPKERAFLLAEIHQRALALPQVEERTVYDGFCREWTPAYYAVGRQLFHVHNFRAGLRATVFLGARVAARLMREGKGVPPGLSMPATPAPFAAVKVPLAAPGDVATLMELVRIKQQCLTASAH